MIKCLICNKEMHGLTLHLVKIHNTTPKEYCNTFPGAKIFSQEALNKPSFGGNKLKGLKKEVPMSQATRDKIASTHQGRTGRKHSPETIAKMKATSQTPEVMQARCEGTQAYYSKPESREKASQQVKARIAATGLHLKRGKVTGCEQQVINALILGGLEFKREQRSNELILNSYRFFDFFIPVLNLIIEVDGEFWHRQEDRVLIDRLKHQDAVEAGYKFLRLSDEVDVSLLNDPVKLLELFNNSIEKLNEHTSNVITQRTNKINIYGFTPDKSSQPSMTPEARAKVLSEKSKAAWTKKIAEGWSMPDETRVKLSEYRKGKVFGPRSKPYVIIKQAPSITEETRAKMCESAKHKKPISEETRAKMAAAQKRRFAASKSSNLEGLIF